jgi:hypothetical protein
MFDDLAAELHHAFIADLNPWGAALYGCAADEIKRLRETEQDLRMYLEQDACEIERLKAALQIAAGKLSTLPPYTEWHPEVIYKALLEDGTEEARRG